MVAGLEPKRAGTKKRREWAAMPPKIYWRGCGLGEPCEEKGERAARQKLSIL